MLLSNTYNWVRADSLQPVSLEMVAVLGGVFLAWRYRASGLVAMFAISLPFNDVVYRLGPLTVSDLLAIAILITRPPKTRPWLVAPLLVWVCWGLLNTLGSSVSLFSMAYGIRFALILLVMGTIDLGNEEARRIVTVLRAVTIFAALISLAQVVLWRLGLPINGVFSAGGFIRPKGLSHEPSTSAAWFAMALPLLSVSRTRRRSFDWPLVVSIGLGLIVTASLSAFIIVGVQAVFFAVRSFRRPRLRRRLVLAGAIAIPAMLLVVALAGSQATLLTGKAEQLIDEYSNGVRPTSIDDSSGREGDLLLLDAAPPALFRGQGVFVSTELASGMEDPHGVYVPAANLIITAAIDTGVIGLVLLLGGLVAVYVGARRELYRRFPAFVDGYAGFVAALLGQRLLAFPQPWFTLAVARGLNQAPTADGEPVPTEGSRPTAHSHLNNEAGDQLVNSDPTSVSVTSAVRRFPISTGLIVVVGLALVSFGAAGRLQSKTVTIDLGASGQNELAAGLDLPVVGVEVFEPQDEAYYINHAYDDVTATVAGEVVVVAASNADPDAAAETLKAFSSDYLEFRNASWTTALESARERSLSLADRATADIETIDSQLNQAAIDESSASQLVLSRAELVSDRSDAEVDAESYRVMLEDGEAVAVVGGPDEANTSSFLVLVGVALAMVIVLLIAVGQAYWRSLRSADQDRDPQNEDVGIATSSMA